MSKPSVRHLPTVPHAGYLGEQTAPLAALGPTDASALAEPPFLSAGISGTLHIQQENFQAETWQLAPGAYHLRCYFLGQLVERSVHLSAQGVITTRGPGLLSGRQAAFLAELERDGQAWTVLLREQQTRELEAGGYEQLYHLYRSRLQRSVRHLHNAATTGPLAQLRVGMGETRSLYPLQLGPSVKDVTGRRVALHYAEAIERLADLLLQHRPPYGRTLVYADGDVDLFGIFALQETLRILGVRNLQASPVWGSLAQAEGARWQHGNAQPSLNLETALAGPGRCWILSGWNGLITHLPVMDQLLNQPDLDVWVIDVMVSETAQMLAEHVGTTAQTLLVRPGGENHLALALAHEILHHYPQAIDQAFLEHSADPESLAEFVSLARSEMFAAEQVVELIAPEPEWADRLRQGILTLAERLAQPDSVPVHIPGRSLSQSGGLVPGCLWNNLLALLGKLGQNPDASLRGGELSFPEQRNEAAQMLHLSPDRFFGGLPVDGEGCRESARRLNLPEESFLPLLHSPAHSILDYARPDSASQRELILCLGNGLEARWMRDHAQWQAKLRQNDTTLVVLDPQPGSLLLGYAALCLPTPPQVADPPLLQDGEGRLMQTQPRRQAPPESHTAATVLYDALAEISARLRTEPDLRSAHPDLAELSASGWLQQRFEDPEAGGGGQLERLGGEVSRSQLWERMQAYLGAETPLLAHTPLRWEEVQQQRDDFPALRPLEVNEQRLNAQDQHGQAAPFRFFVPQEADIQIPSGVLLQIGSVQPEPSEAAVRYAIAAAGCGAGLQHPHLPQRRELYISSFLASRLGLSNGEQVWLEQAGAETLVCPIRVTSWLKGEMVYFHHYPTAEELQGAATVPWLRFQAPLCPYTGIPLLGKVSLKLHSAAPEVTA
ncbi:MAG: hypothetical protein ACO1RX_07180 [Candidatus Sericytochromatia bacterium]